MGLSVCDSNAGRRRENPRPVDILYTHSLHKAEESVRFSCRSTESTHPTGLQMDGWMDEGQMRIPTSANPQLPYPPPKYLVRGRERSFATTTAPSSGAPFHDLHAQSRIAQLDSPACPPAPPEEHSRAMCSAGSGSMQCCIYSAVQCSAVQYCRGPIREVYAALSEHTYIHTVHTSIHPYIHPSIHTSIHTSVRT